MSMRVTEFYSPLSFLRILLKVNRNCPYCFIQMESEDFKDFQNSTKMLQLSNVSYTKVFSDFHQVSIGKKSRQSGRNSNNIHRVQVIESMPRTDIKILISRKQKCDKKLSQAEINDLKFILHCQ